MIVTPDDQNPAAARDICGLSDVIVTGASRHGQEANLVLTDGGRQVRVQT